MSTRLRRGVDVAAKLAGIGYAGSGGTVLVQRERDVLADAPTSIILSESRDVTFQDPLARLGMQVARDVAQRMIDLVGAGAGTATQLLSIFAGTVGDFETLAKEVEELTASIPREPATWSNLREMLGEADPELAEALLEAWESSGEYGVVCVREGRRAGIEVVANGGARFDCFLADRDAAEVVGGRPKTLDSPIVAVVNFPLTSEKDVVPLLELGSQWPAFPFVIVAPMIAGKALDVIKLNRVKGVGDFWGLWTKSVHLDRTWTVHDIAALCGARVIYAGTPMGIVDGEWLGSAKSVEISLDHSLWEPFDDKREGMAAYIERLVGSAQTEWEVDRARERAAALDGGLRILRIQEPTTEATKARMILAEKMVAKVSAAARNGVVRDFGAWAREQQGSRHLGRLLRDLDTTGRVDPRSLWTTALELAVSGARMIRSTEVAVCRRSPLR